MHGGDASGRTAGLGASHPHGARPHGSGERPGARVLAWSARIACILLAPLVVFAAFGVFARIVQHGLTPARVVALTGVVIVTLYAVGYGVAAFWRGPWLARLGEANVYAAYVVCGLLFLLLTPAADPARLSVADQLARLERGAVAPEEFDYGLLARGSGRWGREALERLASASGDPRADAVAELAAAAREQAPAVLSPEEHRALLRQVEVIGEGPPPPDAALDALQDHNWCQPVTRCAFGWADLSGDPAPELVVIADASVQVLAPDPAGVWRDVAFGCCIPGPVKDVATLEGVAPEVRDLMVGDQRLRLQPSAPRE